MSVRGVVVPAVFLALAACSGGGGSSSVYLMSGSEVVAHGGSWFTPLNNGTSTVALYSEQKDLWALHNDGATDLTIDSMTVTVGAGTVAEEFQLYDNAIPSRPTTVSGVVVPAGGSFDFQVRFYPVAGGDRTATLTVTYNGSETLSISLTGKGQTDARFFTGGRVAWEKLVGGTGSEELTGTGVVNAAGEVFYSANADQLVDTFSPDLLVGKLNADGSAGWKKVWNGKYRDSSPDCGQNKETGGTMGSMALDAQGNLVVVGASSPIQQNNQFVATVLKVDPATGNVLWKKAFKPVATYATVSHNAVAYAVDASGPRYLVVGTTEGESQLLVFALDPADGALQYAVKVELAATYNDRAYAIRRDGLGGAWVGGWSNNMAFIAHVGGVDAGRPAIDFVKELSMGTGSNVNAIDVDSSGNAYLSIDRRGAETYLTVARINLDGTLGWARTWSGGIGDRKNSHVAKVVGDTLLVGGRMHVENFDGTQGDGAFAALATADGTPRYSGFHFNGKGPDELTEHRVKGVWLSGKTLTLVTQAYTATMNGERFSGYWYDGLGAFTSENVNVSPLTAVPSMVTTAVVEDLQAYGGQGWVDAPASLVVQDAAAKHDGAPPDADVMVTRIELN